MKNLVLALSLLLSLNTFALSKSEKTKKYVRIYNLEGKKIASGNILSIDDSTMQLEYFTDTIEVHVSNVGLIKTKRSAASNIMSGAGIGAGTGAIIGVATGSPYDGFLTWTRTQGLGIGLLAGSVWGAIVGAIYVPFKKSISYEINGDTLEWIKFRESIGL